MRKTVGSFVTKCAIRFIKIYRNLLSSCMLHSCRFVPSCSLYAEEAIGKHGALLGGWLSMKRILRCQPFSKTGLDPVP